MRETEVQHFGKLAWSSGRLASQKMWAQPLALQNELREWAMLYIDLEVIISRPPPVAPLGSGE